MQEKIKEILDQIETVIVGKNAVMERILMAILAGGHVLMEDVPGVGKTTTAMTFARVLGLQTRRVQFTSDTMPSDIIGFSVYDKDTGKLVYKPGAVMTNLLLADEINRTSSKTQSALLEAMEEGHVSIDGKTHPLPDPFIVLATQNPVALPVRRCSPIPSLTASSSASAWATPTIRAASTSSATAMWIIPLTGPMPWSTRKNCWDWFRTCEKSICATPFWTM